MFSEGIASRAIGQVPLSIATSLAIESAIGIHPDIVVKKPPILEYQEFWVNLRTLFRNFMGSLDPNTAAGVLPGMIAEVLSVEMDTIRSVIAEYSPMTKVVFYYSNYANLEKHYKIAVFRMDNTTKQKEYTALQNQTAEIMLKGHRGEILGFQNKLEPKTQAKTLILTHYPIDLLSHKAFKELVLIESHTGKIKERAQWTDKYYDGKNLPPIPFRADLIQVFGDKETFRPAAHAFRKDLIDLATKFKWTSVTTTDRIRFSVDQLKNPWEKDLLKSAIG